MPRALREAWLAGVSLERRRKWALRAREYKDSGHARGVELTVRYAREASRDYVRCMREARVLYDAAQTDAYQGMPEYSALGDT